MIVFLAFVLIIGGLLAAAELADGVVDGHTEAFDMRLIMSLREAGDANDPLGPPWVEQMMRDFTSLGGTGVLTFIVVAVTLYYVIQGRYREMLILLTAVGGAFLISYFFKGIFDRPRPDLIPAGEYVFTASFPSGHALLAAATYLTLGSILAQLMKRSQLKAYVLLLAFFLMLLVGFSRVYLGVHWPTDVLAGWLLGTVWATLVWLIFYWLRRRGMAESQPPSSQTA
jgi:undecaprenyl-diphosphatase